MAAIGIFDSGYGGLTILQSIRKRLPTYDYIYLGDNARAPYGTRSFELVYQFTLQAVKRLFAMDCPLIILGCNTASAKALRTIQQTYLPAAYPDRRVLGVIRPTAEVVGTITHTRHVGILATPGTILSQSYDMEIHKLWPDIHVTGLACPMWVPLVESGEYKMPEADYHISSRITELLSADPDIDTIILGCTHYPLLLDKIRLYTPSHVTVVPQGRYVAESLESYLLRHSEIDKRLTQNGSQLYYTTGSAAQFRDSAALFLQSEIEVKTIQL